MKDLVLFSNISLNSQPRREMLDGAEHLVVPAVAIKEGVLNNIFYPAHELENFVQAWNGVPVPVNHPSDADNNFVTANSVEVENKFNIGRFYNVFYDAENKSVKGEIWIHIDKAERLGYGELVTSLESGELMEVSTGLYGNTTNDAGTFNGKDYEFTIATIRPDHLALLPNETGACSIEDGCGAMRTNCADAKGACTCKKNKMKKDTEVKPNLFKRVLGWFTNNEKSFDTIRQMLSAKLRETYGSANDEWVYIVDVFESKVVFEQASAIYSQEYTLEDKGSKVTLLGEREAVTVEVVYKPILANQKRNKNKDMKPEHKSALVSALALAMVANVAESVTDESKSTLAALPEDMLRNMASQYKLKEDGTPIVETPASSAPAAAPVTNSATSSPLTSEERQLLNQLKADKDARVAAKRKQVLAVNSNMTEALVGTLEEPVLDAMLANAGENVVHGNFVAAGAIANTGAGAPRVAPGIFLAPPTQS